MQLSTLSGVVTDAGICANAGKAGNRGSKEILLVGGFHESCILGFPLTSLSLHQVARKCRQ